MVDTSLLVAVIGVGGTLVASIIGSYVNLRTTKIQQKFQNNRTVAKYYMEEKLDRLLHLYKLNNEISGGFVEFVLQSKRKDDITISKDKRDRYEEKLREYSDIMDNCGVFLNENQSEILTRCSIICWIVMNSTTEEDGSYKIEWEAVENDPYVEQHGTELHAFRKHTKNVKKMIEDEVNEPIDDLYDRDVGVKDGGRSRISVIDR